MASNPSGLLVIERILRDRDGIWQQIADERDLNRLTGAMLASSVLALACFGAVLGLFHGPLMMLTSAVKLPLLFLMTLAICLPALYLFNLVFGARLSVRQAVSLVMTAITVIAMLSLAFAPISLFFLITAQDYEFFKLLNVAILTLTAFVGLRFLVAGMTALNGYAQATSTAVPATAPATAEAAAAKEPALVAAAVAAADGQGGQQPDGSVSATAEVAQVRPLAAYGGPRSATATAAPGAPSGSMGLLYVWILLFGFVGTQLAWTLRPFFGAPTEEFALFRDIEGNFYAEIFKTLGQLF